MKQLFLLVNFIFFCVVCMGCADYMVTLEGRVYIQDSRSSTAVDSNSNTFHYRRGGSGIHVRSGSIQAKTDGNGVFEMEGSTIDGEILLEVSLAGYETAYLKVKVDQATNNDDIEVTYQQKIRPTGLIKTAGVGGGQVEFHNASNVPNDFSLDNDAQSGEIILFLIKSNDADVDLRFQYTSTSDE